MSVSRIMQQAAAGVAGGAATYVDDVFSTYLYDGTGSAQVITNGILIGDGAENNTELHLTGDDLLDSSPVAKTITVVGNTQVSTSTKKYGTGSLQFDGSGDLLRVAKNAKFNLNDVDFTIEFWANPTGSLPSFAGIISAWDPTLSWLVETVGAAMRFYYNDGSSTAYVDMGSISTNTWTHFAVTAEGSTLRTFKNGTLNTTTTKPTMAGHFNDLSVGAVWPTSVSSTGQWNGYIDDLRVTVGTARYTASFTAPTEALPLDTSVTGKGGLVWIKDRSVSGQYNSLYDTERGANEVLISDQTWTASSANGGVSAFNDDGFSINTYDDVNRNNSDLVSWTFRKQPGFFDVVTWSGDGTTNRQISHSLGSTPGMIIVKSRTGSDKWYTYHRSLGSGKYVSLESASSAFTDSGPFGTDPTDSVFTVGNPGYLNYSGWDYVAYVFAHDAQDFGTDSDEAIIKCGSYTGNGSTSGQTINLGFEPQWVLLKKTTGSLEAWVMHDNMRGIVSDGNDPQLQANSNSAEWSGSTNIDLTATGFKLTSSSAQYNENSQTYIYMAIRRPHKPASEFAATDLFHVESSEFYNSIKGNNFPADMALFHQTGSPNNKRLTARLTDTGVLFPNGTNAESLENYYSWDNQQGMEAVYSSSLGNWGWKIFRRAPGFFDVVTYTGNSSGSRAVPHNLKATPELVFVKKRSGTENWYVQSSHASGEYGILNSSNAFTSSFFTDFFASQATSDNLILGSGGGLNTSGQNYIAYLFATVPGISKVGSYSGTGSNVNVDCGFTSGARFVLVKRTDSTGDWYIWDTARGIVAGNEPYVLINSYNPDVTGTDYIDPLASGFTITSSAPAALNASGGTYLFLAIA